MFCKIEQTQHNLFCFSFRGAMKRVVKAMNRVDQRKHEKFANQFNYALN